MMNIKDNFVHDADDQKYHVVVDGDFIDQQAFTFPEDALVWAMDEYPTGNILVVEKCEFYLKKVKEEK